MSTQFARSYHRIKAIFVAFGTSEYNAGGALNETNACYWPARTNATTAATYGHYSFANDKAEFQMHVGSETFPQCPIRSLADFAYHLEKALDLTASVEGISISPDEPTSSSLGWTSRRPTRGRAAAQNSRAWIPRSAAARASVSR